MNASFPGANSLPDLPRVTAERRRHLPYRIRSRSLMRLAFPPEIEAEYWRDRAVQFVPIVRLSVGLMLPVYLIFLLLDLIFFQRYTGTAVLPLVLGVAAPAALMTVAVTFLDGLSERWMGRLIFLGCAVNGFALLLANLIAQQKEIPVPYETLLVFSIFAYFLIGTSSRAALMLSVVVAVAYVLGSWRLGMPAVQLFDRAYTFAVVILIGGVAALIMELSDRRAWVNERRLRDLAERDALTGLLNQRRFHEEMELRLHLAQRNDAVVAVLILGARYLPSYNQQLGDPAVDDCLVQTARHLAARISGEHDLVARLAGEQFVIFLYGTPTEDAMDMAEQLCISIDQLHLPHPGSPRGVLTPVISVHAAPARELVGSRSAVVAADEALLRLRNRTGERVTLAGHVSPSQA